MRLHHAALTSSSEANAEKFYEGILKLEKLKASFLTRDVARQLFDTDLECPFFLYGNENCAIEVFITNRFPNGPIPITHLCLQVEDRETFLETCQTHGVPITRVSRGESQICFVEDFDGNRFEIK